jgi:anti-sigma factor RsiW
VGFYRRKVTPCERSIRAISLRLDGEISELESAALVRHRAVCEHCCEIAAHPAATTELLREAPLVELERRVVVTSPRRVRRQRVRRTAAVVLVGAGLAVAAGTTLFAETTQKHPSSALGFRDLDEQRQFVQAELIRLEPNAVIAAAQVAPKFVGHALL